MNAYDAESVPELPGFPDTRSGSALDLLDDCRRIADRWGLASVGYEVAAPVPPSSIHGTTVPPASAHAVAGMSEYGS
jgi:hypothetical protein